MPETPSRRRLLHLLWGVPLGLALAALPFFFGSISICGVSGCGGGGFGPAYGPDHEWIIPYCLAAIAVGLGFFLPPWTSLRLRSIVAVAVALIIAALLVAGGFASKYPLTTR